MLRFRCAGVWRSTWLWLRSGGLGLGAGVCLPMSGYWVMRSGCLGLRAGICVLGSASGCWMVRSESLSLGAEVCV